MKTPRDILLDHHRRLEPKLDAIRRTAVAAAGDRRTPAVPAPFGVFNWPMVWWRELILPNRRLWSGLATIWVLLLLINVSQRDPVSSVTGKPASAPALMMSWQVQQRWMNELLAERAQPPEMEPPRNVAPRPRTENGQRLCV